MAAELHIESDFRTYDLPGIAEVQPLVRQLNLPPVPDHLIEDAELVSDAVADGRNVQRRQRVHVTGSEPPQAAIAQAGLLLLVDEIR
jgi:hypothetical protein